MTALDTILDVQPGHLTIADLLAKIEAEERDTSPLSGTAGSEIPADHGHRRDVSQPEIGPESLNGLELGTSVGHVDFADLQGIYVGPGHRPGQALVRITAGWTCEPPAWPMSIPYNKLTEV